MRHYLWWFPAWQLVSVPPIFVASWYFGDNLVSEIIWIISFVGSVLLVVAIPIARDNYRDRIHGRNIDIAQSVQSEGGAD